MVSNWYSYLPRHVLQALLAQPHIRPGEWEQRFTAVLLFVDISGFTAMSESLAQAGRSGTEELTTALNAYFGSMIALIQRSGGIIGKFGGDALTALFPYEPATRSQITLWAAHCALELQTQAATHAAIETSAGAFSLTMKAGLAAGPILTTIVGDPEIRLEYVIAGSVLDRCAMAEQLAAKGQVVGHHELLAVLGDVERTAVHEDYSALTRLTALPTLPPRPVFDETLPPVAHLVSPFLHPLIAQRLRQGQASFINEHRKVTVLFARFEPFAYDDDRGASRKLQTYFEKVIRIVEQYGGYLNKIDMGDKGSKYLVLFGAPVTHENDEERALRCALDLRHLSDTGVAIGLATGYVFCGQVGSMDRQEYTVIGDAVNLAARLMQSAQTGEILTSETTYQAAAGRFAWQDGGQIAVKGKSGQVAVHYLIRARQLSGVRVQPFQYALPMVGRTAELALIEARLQQAQAGQGQMMAITAEAGMGKSRLAAEVIEQANHQGFTVYAGECQSYGATSGYLVWQNILRAFFNVDAQASPVEQQAQVAAVLEGIDADLLPRLPLLSLPLNLPLPDNELTRSLEGKARKESLEALLVTCLRQRASRPQRRPLCLVLEDCHWIDPLSYDLLLSLSRHLFDRPIFILLLYRPEENSAKWRPLSRLSYFTEVALTEFTVEEARQLLQLKLKQLFQLEGEPPGDLLQRMVARAGGNPFYMDEMVNYLHDRQVTPAQLKRLATLELPDSLRSLIISRLDQLAEDSKTVLKVASVVGRTFKAAWLWGVYPQLGSPERVKEQLTLLCRLDIAPLDKPEPELEYLFKHMITREVAYESLAVATRTMLHEQVAQFIEATYATQQEQFLDLLAYHYGQTSNESKQIEYFGRAGAAAQVAYANEAALDYYGRLLDLLTGFERTAVLLELGKVQQLIGRWEEAEESYSQALKLADTAVDPMTQGQTRQALGTLARLKGHYPQALQWLAKARDYYQATSYHLGVGEALREIGVIYWSQGDYDRALVCFGQCLQVARALNDSEAMSRAITNQGLVYTNQQDFKSALEHYKEAYQIALETGNRLNGSAIINNMGNVYLEQGDYSRALASYIEALQIAIELGDRQKVGIRVSNIGNMYSFQGFYSEALACYGLYIHTTLDLGDRPGTSLAAHLIANVLMAHGRLEESAQFLLRAINLAVVLNIPYELSSYLLSQTNLLAAQGKCEAAQQVVERTLQLATELENESTEFEAQITAVRLTVLLDQVTAVEAIGQLARLLHKWTGDEQQAALHYEIWRLDNQSEENREQAAVGYQHLYEHTPNSEYRQRYFELTGAHLPESPPLPPLPDIVSREPVALDSLLVQLDALLTEVVQEPVAVHEHHA